MRMSIRTFLLCALLLSLPASVRAEPKVTLANCSIRYGELMVDHWLTFDLARQAERGIGYLPKDKSALFQNDLEKLWLWLETAEARLAEVRAEYKILLATNSVGRT